MANLIKRTLSSIILLPLVFYLVVQGSFTLFFFTIICYIVACYEWHKIVQKKFYKLFGTIFLIFSFYTFYEISINQLEFFFVILICVTTDIGGYAFGKTFKGPKLTKISPNKTYAGMLGGFFLSLISVTMIPLFEVDVMQLSGFLFVIGISCVSQIGDITISYFKRLFRIKDTGKIIPGHGGLLDRVDGMIFAFPFTFIIIYIGLF